jgi:hypothetical protein
MVNTKYVFIGGKQIGVNCLRQLIKRKILPEIVIGNMDDDGKDKSWHESLIKLAETEYIPYIKNK